MHGWLVSYDEREEKKVALQLAQMPIIIKNKSKQQAIQNCNIGGGR
jgi:hypothetical protein